MNRLPLYLHDSVAVVCEHAYLLAKLIGKKSQWAPTRKQVVRWLIAGTRDENTGNAGAALRFLTEFQKNDFTRSSKDSLLSLLHNKQPHIETLAKLIGFLEIKDSESILDNLSQNIKLGRKERWACTLALARLGNVTASQNVISAIKQIQVDDALVYQVFPDLIYTRSKHVFAYLLEQLNNNSKNCSSGDVEQDENIPCAYRIMELMTSVIVDFPLKQDITGDIMTTNYEASLRLARDWFSKNPGYKLLKENF